jgi:hypothetical protein
VAATGLLQDDPDHAVAMLEFAKAIIKEAKQVSNGSVHLGWVLVGAGSIPPTPDGPRAATAYATLHIQLRMYMNPGAFPSLTLSHF